MKECFAIAFNEARKHNLLLVGTVPLKITFVQPDKRKRDLDNLLAASKSALDSVAQAIGIDDKQFDPITISRGYGEVGKMILEI